MTIWVVPLQAARSAGGVQPYGGGGVSWQGGCGGGTGGIALCAQQPGLAATDRDVPGGGHRAGGSGDGLRATAGQRPAVAGVEGLPERV